MAYWWHHQNITSSSKSLMVWKPNDHPHQASLFHWSSLRPAGGARWVVICDIIMSLVVAIVKMLLMLWMVKPMMLMSLKMMMLMLLLLQALKHDYFSYFPDRYLLSITMIFGDSSFPTFIANALKVCKYSNSLAICKILDNVQSEPTKIPRPCRHEDQHD